MRKIFTLAVAATMLTLVGAGLTPAAAGTTAPTIEQWRAGAAAGEITLQLDGRAVRVSLSDNPIISDAARASLARHGVDITGVQTLQGTVVGDRYGLARITITPNEVMGYVRTSHGTFDVAARGTASTITRPAATGLVIDSGVPEAAHLDCEGWVPGHYATEGVTEDEWGPRLTFDLAVVVDQTYVAQWSKGGGSWANTAIATVNSADGIYDQIQIDINLVDLHSDTFPNTTSSALLNDIKFHYRAYHPDLQRDAVAMLVYKEIGPLGQASCIGGAGLDDRGNLVMTTNAAPFNFLGVQLYSNIYGKTLAHEMGHLLRAHHHYSNCHEASREPVVDACTMMTPFVDELDETIGTLESIVIRGWANEHI